MKRYAFSMLELIFVIVVMGILAKFGVDLFKQTFEGYARSVILNTLESKSEAAVQQIANRLRYRIKDSITYDGTTLQWAGIAYDAWRNDQWSGIIDLWAPGTSENSLVSPGTIAFGSNLAMVFIGANVNMSNLNHYIPVTTGAGTLTPATAFSAGDDIFEFYQLTDSAYTLQINGTQLFLWSNYQPWNGDAYTDGTSALLVDDLDTFTYQKEGDMIKIELCLSNNNFVGEGVYQVCKQKIIF